MTTHQADIQRLSLLIQRILDAEVLSDTESAALLMASEAAYRSLEEGDTEDARQHLERIAHFTEALLQAEALDLRDGRAVIQVTDRILNSETEAQN